jgi:hypothetical protein
MKEGNNNTYKVSGGLGLISSRLMVEGPVTDQISFMFRVAEVMPIWWRNHWFYRQQCKIIFLRPECQSKLPSTIITGFLYRVILAKTTWALAKLVTVGEMLPELFGGITFIRLVCFQIPHLYIVITDTDLISTMT